MNNIAGSLAGTSNAERAAEKAKRAEEEKKRVTPRKIEDRVDVNPDAVTDLGDVEQTEQSRSLTDNTRQETQQDREEHVGYTNPRVEGVSRIDLSA